MPDDETVLAVNKLSELNQAQRRVEVSKKVETALPEYIRSIVSSEVLINISPKLIPSKLINPNELLKRLKESYSLHLDTEDIFPDVVAAATNFGVDSSKLNEATIIGNLLKYDEFSLTFVDGRFPTGPNTFVAINFVGFSQEAIQVNVSGVTDVAELLIAEVFETLWQSSGASKRWDSEEVKRQITLKSYGTRTKVDFAGTDLLSLMNNNVLDYFKRNLDSNQKFGSQMMTRSSFDSFDTRQDVISFFNLDELHFRFNLVDRRTGWTERSLLRLSVTTKDEAARGIADIISEMPFDAHVKFVKGLIEALRN